MSITHTEATEAPCSRCKIAWSLLTLRIGIAIVFMMWTIDKFLYPAHASAVFATFYKVPDISAGIAVGIGILQLTLVIAFTLGLYRTHTYGAVLVIHTISTIISYPRYLDPWAGSNLLFFAAFPMLAACIVLWVLRSQDTYSLDGRRLPSYSDA